MSLKLIHSVLVAQKTGISLCIAWDRKEFGRIPFLETQLIAISEAPKEEVVVESFKGCTRDWMLVNVSALPASTTAWYVRIYSPDGKVLASMSPQPLPTKITSFTFAAAAASLDHQQEEEEEEEEEECEFEEHDD